MRSITVVFLGAKAAAAMAARSAGRETEVGAVRRTKGRSVGSAVGSSGRRSVAVRAAVRWNGTPKQCRKRRRSMDGSCTNVGSWRPSQTLSSNTEPSTVAPVKDVMMDMADAVSDGRDAEGCRVVEARATRNPGDAFASKMGSGKEMEENGRTMDGAERPW